MPTIAEQLTSLNSNVNTINIAVTSQADLIAQIKAKANNLPLLESGTDTSDATATASDILSPKTAYVDGGKVTGTIATKTSSNLTASGATVTVPAGYYASQATKSVASGSATTPATTITTNPTISVDSAGKITASYSGSKSVTPTVSAGYVSSGTAGTISTSGSATKQLTTQAAKTITPSTSSQTAIAAGTYATGAVTVAAIPSSYVKPSATQAAKTWSPLTTVQTIPAGTYCSGAQTIAAVQTESKLVTPSATQQTITPSATGKYLSGVVVEGDSDLKAANIKSGVQIFGVTGSYTGESSTFELYGSYAMYPENIYDWPAAGSIQFDGGIDEIYAYFYNGSEYQQQCVDQIIYDVDSIKIISADSNAYLYYDSIGWGYCPHGGTESYDMPSDETFRVITITSPISLSQSKYDAFRAIMGDWMDVSPYDIGHGAGYAAGAANGIEALGALCDWQITTNSASYPVVTVINYHPTYYLRCQIEDEAGNVVWDWDTGDDIVNGELVVPPNGQAVSVYIDDSFSVSKPIYINRMRWTASGT